MSYNIDSAKYLSGRLSIRRDDALALLEDGELLLPEGCMIEDVTVNSPEVVEINNPWWNGELSGYSYPDSLKKVLAKTTGEADILLTWGGGDCQTGVRVKDGKVTFHRVNVVLGEEVKR